MTCYRGFLLGSCCRVAGGRAAALRGPGAGGGGRRHLGQGQPRELAGCGSRPDGGFRPSRVVVVAKTTRYEFEQQRYRYAELSEEDLKQLLALKGSSYSGLLERHHIHTKNVEHILDSLRNEGIEVRLVKRREYDEETVRWADAVIAAGGDGTMLLAASKVLDRLKPVIGVNTDPERWLWRQRIRLYLEGTGINPVPVDLHEQQLSLNQHSRAFNIERVHDESSTRSSLFLKQVVVGAKLSQVASYYEISVDDGPWEKQKSSGLNLCTGTGSKACHIILTMLIFGFFSFIVTNEYNESLLYSPEEPKILFSIREPIANRIFSSSRQRCFTSKVCVRSRCWDACMVVDGGTSFEFNDGAIASMLIEKEDELRTVLLEQ
uniref:NAD(+) kinase n=1 Tax=Capra hircus TaxID=9925 RepID=A0A8C2RF73_CAPHI